jgi:hypothetical protein
MMPYPLTPNTRVRLTREAVIFYGGQWPHWVPTAQGGGQPGTLVFAGERPHKPGAAPRPYYVAWDNGAENSYRVEDLEAVPEEEAGAAPAAPVELPGDEPDEPPSNIIPFAGRR